MKLSENDGFRIVGDAFLSIENGCINITPSGNEEVYLEISILEDLECSVFPGDKIICNKKELLSFNEKLIKPFDEKVYFELENEIWNEEWE